MVRKDGLDEQVTLRVASADVARIDSLADQLPLKRSAVIRAALRLGLAALEEDPAQMFKARANRPAPQPAVAAPMSARPVATTATGTWGRPGL